MSEKLCAVIVTFNNAAMLSDLLNDLRIQSRLSDEAIVVDTAHFDQTETVAKINCPAVNYIRTRRGFGQCGWVL